MNEDKCVPDQDGNCQHAAYQGGRSWTIPYGTHIIGGRTVSVTIFSNSPDTNLPKEEDKLVEDLMEMLNIEDRTELMSNLVPYLVDRDHKILAHGIELGWKQSNERLASECERILKEANKWKATA